MRRNKLAGQLGGYSNSSGEMSLALAQPPAEFPI